MRRSRALLAFALLGLLACTAAESEVVTPQDTDVEALRTYAKLYGYVRYFHPSDEAAELDWDRFAVYGAGEVLKVARAGEGADREEVRRVLQELFGPIAPTVQIFPTGQAPNTNPELTAADSAGVEFVAWQHLGVGSGPMYRSIRLNRPNRLRTSYGGAFGGVIQSIDAEPLRGRRVRLEAVLRAEVEGTGNEGRIWLRVDRPNQETGFFSNMGDSPVRSSEWTHAEILGPVADDATVIVFGCFLAGSGTLWSDEFRLSVEDEDGNWSPIDIENPGFEEIFGERESPVGWGGRNAIYRYAATTEDPHSGERSLRISHDAGDGTEPFTGRLFDRSPSPGEFVDKELGAGLWARIPVSLPSEDGATIPKAQPGSIDELNRALDGLPADLSGNEEAVRVGDIVIAWNVFQHFYPYFDVVPTDWDTELTLALESALSDGSEAEFLLTLRRLTAALHDGHAGANHAALDSGLGHLPLTFGWVERRVVVTASDVPAVQPGDILVSIDGIPAAEALADEEAYISGSPQWMRFRALLAIGRGEMEASVQLVLERDGTTSDVSLERRSQMPPEEERPPQIAELEPGIWYVNLGAAPWPDIQENLDAIAGARGVVFDLRGYPKGNHQVISHLLTEPDTSSAWMRIPQVIYPDFEGVTWEHASWGMKPLKPHIEGKVVFITDGRAISYAESFMGFIEGYRLAEIVGQPTAGTNGNVNPFGLPGGYRVRFTGMLVVKHDGSQHHLVGVQPTVPAERSLEGVREGRDELLEVALELVR